MWETQAERILQGRYVGINATKMKKQVKMNQCIIVTCHQKNSK